MREAVASLVVAFLVGGVTCAPEAEAAGPASCQWTSARARKDEGPASAPALCALNQCRQVGYKTFYADSAMVNPMNPDPTVYRYHVEASAQGWAGLPACPSWTNTSTWSAP